MCATVAPCNPVPRATASKGTHPPVRTLELTIRRDEQVVAVQSRILQRHRARTLRQRRHVWPLSLRERSEPTVPVVPGGQRQAPTRSRHGSQPPPGLTAPARVGRQWVPAAATGQARSAQQELGATGHLRSRGAAQLRSPVTWALRRRQRCSRVHLTRSGVRPPDRVQGLPGVVANARWGP